MIPDPRRTSIYSDMGRSCGSVPCGLAWPSMRPLDHANALALVGGYGQYSMRRRLPDIKPAHHACSSISIRTGFFMLLFWD